MDSLLQAISVERDVTRDDSVGSQWWVKGIVSVLYCDLWERDGPALFFPEDQKDQKDGQLFSI